MARYARLGIYGGTFDPPHIGHLHAANAFLQVCDLDALYIVPTGTPPHKDPSLASAPHMRMDMVRLAFGDAAYADDRIHISDFEQTKEGKSYTYDTLCHFKSEADCLYLLCGEDMFLTLTNWYRAEDIFSLAEIVCFRRNEDFAQVTRIEEAARHYESAFGAHIHLPDFSPLSISSTGIRRALQCGQSTEGCLTTAIQTYIKEHDLYKL